MSTSEPPPAVPGPTGYRPPAADDVPPGYGPRPGYGSPAGYAPPGYGAQTSTKAVIALVLAIASFLMVPLIPAVVALVLAGSAGREIALSGGRLSGGGLLTAARVVAWINVGLCVLAALLLVGAFVLFAGTGFS